MGVFYRGSQLELIRVVAAFVILVLMVGAAIYTAEPANDPAKQYALIHGVLAHGAELLLGVIVGLLVGEGVGKG